MVTYAQLAAEPWWDREIVTAELDWLGDELCRRTGRPRTAAGTKGDNHHVRGAHRSQEWIKNSAYCTNRTYTVQSGLTAEQARHVAGFDFTPGSAEQMITQCQRLMTALKAGELEQVREFYGNVDGDQIVDGWNNLENRAATSDSSHVWHWHLSIDRRHLTDQPLMERILAVALDLEDDMNLGDAVKLPLILGNQQKVASVEGCLAYTLVRSRSAELSLARIETQLKALTAAAAGDVGRDERTAAAIAELRELVTAAQSGKLTADQVVDKIAERLGVGAGAAGA